MTHNQARATIRAARNLQRPLPTRVELDEAYKTLPHLYQVGCACFATALAVDIGPGIASFTRVTVEEC